MIPEQTVTIRVPLAVRRRGGRKVVITPAGMEVTSGPVTSHADPSLVKALARAFRWKRLLEDGTYGSISEIAAAEKIDRGYLGRILQLTLPAPDIVEAILNGKQPVELGLPRLMKPFPINWHQQRATFSVGVAGDNQVSPGCGQARQAELHGAAGHADCHREGQV